MSNTHYNGRMAEGAAAGNWESHILEQGRSARAQAMTWNPWAARPLPTPAVEPIMLTGGIPDPGALPIEDLIACNDRVLRREGTFALMYGGPQGYPGLREWLAHDFNRREGGSLDADNFIVTCGSAGALELVCETFVDPGDIAIIERPTFPGSLRTILSCLPEITGVAVDDEGLNVDALERVVTEAKTAGKRIKLLYTIANYHNPAAATLTVERRKAIIELCRREQILIVQDDAYGRLAYEGETPPSLFSLAGGEGVALLGTFSKTLATGLRLGWIMSSAPLIETLTSMRFDMGTSPWASRVIAEYCQSGLLDDHVPRVISLYRRKRDAMCNALVERCSKYARWSVPQGGFFLWLELSEGIDTSALYEAANDEGVGYVGGRPFFDDGSGSRFVRLCYSNVAESDIPEAIMRFGRALERAVVR